MADIMKYPESKTIDQIDNYHGIMVHDPYRWLEDLSTEDVLNWVDAQNAVSLGYLQDTPNREAIRMRLEDLWTSEKYELPTYRGDRFFWMIKTGLQNQPAIYVSNLPHDNGDILLNPNELSTEGSVSVWGYEVSPDGGLLAYALSSRGSNWQQWRIRDVATGIDLDDVIEWSKFWSVSWTSDQAGFYYGRYDEPGEDRDANTPLYNHKLFYHKVGTQQREDVLIYERPDEKEWCFIPTVTNDGRYLVVAVGRKKTTTLLYKDLKSPASPLVMLLNETGTFYEFLGNKGTTFWFKTDHTADNGRVIAIDIRNPEPSNWISIIPEEEQALESVSMIGDHLLASYVKDACSCVKVFTLDGRFVRNVDLPGLGTAWGFPDNRFQTDTYYLFASFTTPEAIYRYDTVTGESEILRKPAVDFATDDYEVSRVVYSSRDGTRVPMFLVHRKNLVRDGSTPTLLYGYGGFNASITPGFSIEYAVWLELGGIWALPNLRGGGEFGRTWYEAGKKENKQNVFDDFIAAGEWLIANRYTSTPKLAITGRSNGGLLIGACLTQRPDLFGAAIPIVGIFDMCRFHKFTTGWYWTSEYGSPDDPDAFQYLLAYSPLHNIKPGTKYPATLIAVGDRDESVVPSHSYKFAAALQAANEAATPVLIRIEKDTGHRLRNPRKIIEESTDRLAFLRSVLHLA